MDENLRFVFQCRINRIMHALKKNRMDSYFVENKKEALETALSLLPKGCTVSHGGSQTLIECGVPQALREGDYIYLDRAAPGLTPEEVTGIYRKSFFADCYLGSANALTEQGEIINLDGNGNRVAAYIYGPASVILIVGMNKIVPDMDSAFLRLRKIAAPANVKRLSCQTPCLSSGECMNCTSPGHICCNYVVQRFQREPGRMKVILVGESLGY